MDDPQKKNKFNIFAIIALLVALIAFASAQESINSWTYVTLHSNFSTANTTSVNVGLNFTPQANKNYDVQVYYMVRSPVLETVAPRPGLNWSSGLIDGVAFIQSPALQTVVQTNCNINTTCIAPIGGLDSSLSSYGGTITSIFQSGSNSTGKIEVTLASETEGTQVMMMKGSYLKYRVYN